MFSLLIQISISLSIFVSLSLPFSFTLFRSFAFSIYLCLYLSLSLINVSIFLCSYLTLSKPYHYEYLPPSIFTYLFRSLFVSLNYNISLYLSLVMSLLSDVHIFKILEHCFLHYLEMSLKHLFDPKEMLSNLSNTTGSETLSIRCVEYTK